MKAANVPLHDIKNEAFFNYLKESMQNDQNIEIEPNQYTSNVLYKNTAEMKSKIYMNLIYGVTWLGAAVSTYLYIPYFYGLLTLIPAWLFAGNMIQYQVGRRYITKLVKQIEISDDKQQVIISLTNGSQLDVQITDIDFIDIIELGQQGGKSIKSFKENEKPTFSQDNHFIAIFDVVDKNKKDYNDLRILITDNIIEINNISMLKHVLLGETAQLSTFEKVDLQQKQQEQKQSSEQADKDMEKELEEEIESIKNEKKEDINNEKQK